MLPFPELTRNALEAKNRVLLMRLQSTVLPAIERRREQFRNKSDDEIKRIVEAIRKHVAAGEKPKDLDVNLLAAIGEASRRTLQLDPFKTQILAALLLGRNKVIQMNTGEGKTLVAPFVAIGAVLRGMRVVVATANPYLSSRDAEWMRPLYDFFDIRCGALSPDMSQAERYQAYDQSVVYVPGSQLILDYLAKHHAVARQYDYPIPRSLAILDEIDNILIDQGNQKYVLGDSVPFHTESFVWATGAAAKFREHEHFEAQFGSKNLTLNDQGRALLREISSESSGLQPLQAQFFLRSALKARVLYRPNVDYLVEGNRVVLINSVTGRPEPGNVLSFGLQQALEEKERVPYTNPLLAFNEITAQGFYRGFAHVCGMSGSAVYNALEFAIFYKLDVVPIPPHLPCRREDLTDLVFRTRAEQLLATVADIREAVGRGRPVLVGTLSVEEAEEVSDALEQAGVAHQLLTARNYRSEAGIIESAGQSGRVTVAAKLAGRGVDIVLTDESRQAGGLHVIGFGRGRERRLDEQLAGRSGRQGDLGTARFIVSLEDDLMRIFAKEWVSNLLQRLGMEEGVPIESKFIGRRIFRAQQQLTLMSFSSRNWLMLLDECTRDMRTAVFDQRVQVASAYQLKDEIDLLFERQAKRVLHGASGVEQALTRVHDMAAELDIEVDADIYTSGDLHLMSEALKRMFREQYELRRAKAGDEAPPRERVLHLRTIDHVWAKFLVSLRLRTERLSLGDSSGYSNWTQLADLLPFFSGQAQRLSEEIDRNLAQNLFKIDQPMAMYSLGVWIDQETAESDDSMIRALRAAEREFDRHPENIQPEASLGEYLDAYRGDIQCDENAADKEGELLAVLAGFKVFLDKRSFAPAAAFQAVADYKRGRFMSLRRRRLERETLEAFLEHLVRQGLVQKPNDFAPSAVAIRRGHLATSRFFEPLMVLKWVILLLSLVAYPKVVSVPLAAICPGFTSHLPRATFVPAAVRQFYDDAYLGGSWGKITLGLIGVTPILLTQLLFRFFWPQNNAPPIVFSAPVALLACVGVMSAIHWANRLTPAPSPWCNGSVFASLVAATMVILLIVDLVQVTELVGRTDFVVIINLSIVLYHNFSAVWRQLLIQWWALGLVAAIAFLLWLSDRRAALDFSVLTTGTIDGQNSDVQTRPTDLRVTTIFDNQHLIVGFLAAALVQSTVHRLQPNTIFPATALAVMAFGLAAFATLALAARSRLSSSNIDEFLENRNAALNGGAPAMAALQRRLFSRCTTNAGIRTTLFAMLMVLAGLLSQRDTPGAFSEHILYVPVIFMLWSYLAIAVIRSTRFLFTGYSSTLEITIPEPKLTEEEDLPRWQRWWARALRMGGGGPVQLVVLVAAFFEALEQFWKIAEWSYRHVLTTYHHLLPPIHPL